MIKKVRIKLVTAFMVIMVFMATIASYQSYAALLPETMITAEHQFKADLRYGDLAGWWDLLCGQHIQHIPSDNDINYATNGSDSICINGQGAVTADETLYNKMNGKDYLSESATRYEFALEKICTPKSAYLLTFAKDENGGSYPDIIQSAWWSTNENTGNAYGSNTTRENEATAYLDFVKKIAKNPADVNGNKGEPDTTSNYAPTTKYPDLQFPKIDIASRIHLETSMATVNYSENLGYVIGPLWLMYPDDSYNGIDFGLLDGFYVHTDVGTVSLGTGNFIYPQGGHDGAKVYPASNEKFYIRMDYRQEMTKITGMDVDYKYLICAGKYKVLKGKYDILKWTCERDSKTVTDYETDPITGDQIEVGSHTVYYNYRLESEKYQEGLEAQLLCLLVKAARWYEVERISLEFPPINTPPTTPPTTPPEPPVIDLTFEMGGTVWVDRILDKKNNLDGDHYYSQINGILDVNEQGQIIEPLKKGVEVYVYVAGTNTLATAYTDINNTPVSWPILTNENGRWDIPRMPVPPGGTGSYDVRFVYDGQTYESTIFLARSNGNPSDFKNASTAERNQYARNSMAYEVSNNGDNISEIYGGNPIGDNGSTVGYINNGGTTPTSINYTSSDAGSAYPIHSDLVTEDSREVALEPFKATARTEAGGLTFPFDTAYSLTGSDRTIAGTTYTALYRYCKNINLGLAEKEVLDVSLTKNLDKAVVVVNERMYQYNYSGLYDLTEDHLGSLSKDVYIDYEEDIEYTLGLYQSDYYYRAEMYKDGDDSTVYDALADFYRTLYKEPEDTELDVYLTYRLRLKNASPIYDVKINSIDDYYDSTFSLVTADETKYLKTKTVAGNQTNVNDNNIVARDSYYVDGDKPFYQLEDSDYHKTNWNWQTTVTNIAGSDGVQYNKMTANNMGIVLKPEEEKEYYVTFKVNKANDTQYGITDSVILGQKCNVAEIANYTTYYTTPTDGSRIIVGNRDRTGKVFGKIDRDSAPGNVNLTSHNVKPWYEDDTFAAPSIKLNLLTGGVDRQINGVVWEDNSRSGDNTENPDYNQLIGNGIKESSEKEIAGLTTNLVEKIAIKNANGNYTEYDYIWPTADSLECLNGRTMEEVLGLDTTIETDNHGNYAFNNIITGDYVVRFVYGDTRPNVSHNERDIPIASANYSEADYYNGQDYKSAKFKGNLQTGDLLQADSYLDIDNYYLNRNDNARLNTAVDSEVRRLQVVEKSREINYANSSVMADYEGDKYNNELYKTYDMFADTPKIDMNVESSQYNNDVCAYNGNYTYQITNVDFGLEERPITQLTLDKQIEEIILTTSDGTNIMDAKYNINYQVKDDGSITANVELDTANSYGIDNLQALNRDEATNHGFRYINVDTDILEGTTVTVKYKFTVLNTGEVDRTGELATMLYSDDLQHFKESYENLSNHLANDYTKNATTNALENSTVLGNYVGNIYYYGADKKNGVSPIREGRVDEIVTSTVRQLVDYIDNHVTFSGSLNATQDMSWSNITTEDLRELIDPAIINSEKIVDSKGVQYETGNRNNMVVSVDGLDRDRSNGNSSLNNKNFVIELQPEFATRTTGANFQAAMYLTTTQYVDSASGDLQINNIAEIIRYNNKVGRRDELSIAGNQNPAQALETKNPSSFEIPTPVSDTLIYERDTSATEVITLSPPTGTHLKTWRLQVIVSITASLVVIAGGIVLIKKKILK